MLLFHEIGDWAPSAVAVRWGPCSRREEPQVERVIASTWADSIGRPGLQLFDGPMCRLEGRRVEAGRIELVVSRTSYRLFFGTNLMHPTLADRYGPQVMANPIGVSAALTSADGMFLLGRRSATVAYYPLRTHPFAGALEPRDQVDVFGAVARELEEELKLGSADIADIRLAGIVEDHGLRQPELIFTARTSRTLHDLRGQMDHTEHNALYAVPARREAIDRELAENADLTPVAQAAMLLWGRAPFGAEWFDRWRLRLSDPGQAERIF